MELEDGRECLLQQSQRLHKMYPHLPKLKNGGIVQTELANNGESLEGEVKA
jgi:hypothetical protein